ncbi:MAG: hypothetical protein ABH847_00925 [Candidatus Omnitrophota bacterium]
MRKSTPIFLIILVMISFSNIVISQEPGGVSMPTEIQPTVPVEAPQSPEAQPQPAEIPSAPAVSEEKPKSSDEIVLLDDFLSEGSTQEGTWNWDSALKYSGEKSHTEPAGKEIVQHSYKSNSIEIPKNSVIEQYVYLDPNEIPKGIMLKFRVENDGKETETGAYWEGEEEVFVYSNDEPMLYHGVLPNAGKWEKLEIYSEDLGLEGAKLTGISFIVYGGKANWDLTKIRPIKEGEGYP